MISKSSMISESRIAPPAQVPAMRRNSRSCPQVLESQPQTKTERRPSQQLAINQDTPHQHQVNNSARRMSYSKIEGVEDASDAAGDQEGFGDNYAAEKNTYQRRQTIRKI